MLSNLFNPKLSSSVSHSYVDLLCFPVFFFSLAPNLAFRLKVNKFHDGFLLAIAIKKVADVTQTPDRTVESRLTQQVKAQILSQTG